MVDRVFVHVGAAKAGSTYLQTLLWANQEVLEKAGVLVPGRNSFDHNRVMQMVRMKHPDEQAQAAWRLVMDRIAGFSGTVVISNEWLCLARPRQIRRLFRALAPREVHVVATARDLVGAVPSAWQENLKLGAGRSLPEFIAWMDDPDARWKWGVLDPALFLPRWAEQLPPGRVHVIPLDPLSNDPDLLWKRFAGLIGVDPDVIDLEVGRSNESLSAEGARFLELTGDQVREAVDGARDHWNWNYRLIRDYLSHELVAQRRGRPIALSDEDRTVIEQRAKESVARLVADGYDIVGDVDELTRQRPRPNALRPEDVPDAAVIDMAGHVVAEMLLRIRRESDLAKQAKREAAALRKQVAELEARRPLRAARRGLSRAAALVRRRSPDGTDR